MGILIWIIGAIAIAIIRNRAGGKFPKFPRLPDGRHDTPLGPSGHRSWPPKQPASLRPAAATSPPAQHPRRTPQPETAPIGIPESLEPVTISAPDYQIEKRRQPATETERVFAGESAYDRMESHPVDRPARRRSPVAFNKNDLVRAVVMAEVLGPPRSRQSQVIPGKRRK